MPHKTMRVEGIELHVYQKSFRVCDDAIGSEIVFPPTINEETITSLVSAIYRVVERRAIESAKMKVEAHMNKVVNKLVFGEDA